MKNFINPKLTAVAAVFVISLHLVAFAPYCSKLNSENSLLKTKHLKKDIDVGFFTINNQQFRAYGDGNGNITEIDAYTADMIYIAPVDSFSMATYTTSPRETVTADIIYNSVPYNCYHLDTYE